MLINRTRPLTSCVLALLVVLMVAACSSNDGAVKAPATGPVTVELDIFSGRPNPSWQLDSDGKEQLDSILAGLNAASGEAPEVGGLGYRGFLLGPVRAYAGFVSSPDGVRADPDRSVERFLLESLPSEFGDLKGSVEAEL